MSINTNLKGRLRNTQLPPAHGLMPLFEAVANAIHAIEDARRSPSEGRIGITVEREPQLGMFDASAGKKAGAPVLSNIQSFKVTDNGVGFSDDNMTSFETLDSEYKASRGGRGVGRLIWLKAFRQARVSSVFADASGQRHSRSFDFTPDSGVANPQTTKAENTQAIGTSVSLLGFEAEYRDSVPKRSSGLAAILLEHCLWYFVRPGGMPNIMIEDGGETINLADLYAKYTVQGITSGSFTIKETTFEVIHVRLSAGSDRSHALAYCAGGRMVIQRTAKDVVPGLVTRLTFNGEPFVYQCYVTSPFLDNRVHSDRQEFNITHEAAPLHRDKDIGWREIEAEVSKLASEFLQESIALAKTQGEERLLEFIQTKAPRYRPLQKDFQNGDLTIDAAINDKELELQLHKVFADKERELMKTGQELLVPVPDESRLDYKKRVLQYAQQASALKQSDLAGYVFHRRTIIDLLASMIELGPAGKFKREDELHNLIMPMGYESGQLLLDECNLWLIDERLAFHHFLASDRPISQLPITGSKSATEPDIVSLEVFDNPLLVGEGGTKPSGTITIVELKRPMRNDAAPGPKDDPIEQCYAYLDRIREGKVTLINGRPIADAENVPAFCYVVCDLSLTIRKRVKIHQGEQTSDKLGYFFYNKDYKCYVEVISYERLVECAKQRNRAFFDKLGLPTA